MARLKLLGPRILIKPLSKKTMSDGGIHYDMSRMDDDKQWEVIDVGPGRRMKNGTVKPLEVKPGDRVLVGVTGENLYEWTDRVRVIDVSEVVAII